MERAGSEIVYCPQAAFLATAKEEVRKILDALPDDATWEDVQYSIYVRERIEPGGWTADQEKLIDQEEVEIRINESLLAGL